MAFQPADPSRRAGAGFSDDPRLSEPRLAQEPNGAPLSAVQPRHGQAQRLKLAVSTHERCAGLTGVMVGLRGLTNIAEHEHRHAVTLALHPPLTQRNRVDIWIDQPSRRLGEVHRTWLGKLLHARRQIGGVANRGVVHPQVVSNAANDNRSRVEPHPHRQGGVEGRARPRLMLPDRLLDARRGERGTPRVVFARDGRPEQRHETIPQELIDGALISMNLCHRNGEERLEQRVHALLPKPLGENGGVGEVAEEHGDLLSLALDRGWQVEEGSIEMFRGVPTDAIPARRCRTGRRGRVLLAAGVSHLGQRMRKGRTYLAACRACGQGATAEPGTKDGNAQSGDWIGRRRQPLGLELGAARKSEIGAVRKAAFNHPNRLDWCLRGERLDVLGTPPRKSARRASGS